MSSRPRGVTNSRSGAMRAVSDSCMVVQSRDGREELPNEIQRRVQVEDPAGALDIRQDIDQPIAGDAIGHERNGAALVVEPVDLSDAGKGRMVKIREPRDPLAQRELERGNVGDLVAKTQNFQRRVAVEACGGTVTPAETILEATAYAAGFACRYGYVQHW